MAGHFSAIQYYGRSIMKRLIRRSSKRVDVDALSASIKSSLHDKTRISPILSVSEYRLVTPGKLATFWAWAKSLMGL